MLAGDEDDAFRLGLAREAARAIYRDPSAPVPYEPRGASECREAVTALSECFLAAGGTVAQIVANARAAAQVLSDDHLQGVSEIVQNADDAGATFVCFHQTADWLIAAHNGLPLTLRDVHALAAPWLTTKTDQAPSTGRFGIGLLTLHALAPAFEIHSDDYHLTLGEPTLAAIPPAKLPNGLAASHDTILRVPLAPDTLQDEELLRWCANWDDSSLLFLQSVRQVTFTAGGSSRKLELAVEHTRAVELVAGTITIDATCGTRRAPDGRQWSVYQAEFPSPPGLRRAHKKTELTTPIAVALPLDNPAAGGRLYAGLPVVNTSLRVYANAQFDPVASRQSFAETPWNVALAALVGELWTGAILDLFQQTPEVGWQLIPLSRENGNAEHINQLSVSFAQRLEKLINNQSDSTIPTRLRLPVEGALIPVSELAVEDRLLEGLLTAAEVADLAQMRNILPMSCRDDHGRWRDVLDHWRAIGLELPTPVSVTQALPLIEDEARTTTSTIALAAAAIEAGLEVLLARLRCIVLADGSRTSPPVATDLRVLAGDGAGLGERLGIAQSLHPAYFVAQSAEANAVMRWLGEQKAYIDGTKDRVVLMRIAGAGMQGVSMPEALSDTQLIALRDALELLGRDAWERLGPGIGRAIKLDAFQYGKGSKRIQLAASPAVAYQPKAIDREPDSFAFAADTAPGLVWLEPKYATVLRSSAGRAGLGAQRLLRLFGAATSPRLVPHPDLEQRFAFSVKGLRAQLTKSPSARTQALRDLNARFTLEDYYCPDLEKALDHIARDGHAERRRSRAAAIITVLGRDWPTLSEHAEVRAANDYYVWENRGSTRAWWLWRAGSVSWLDNVQGNPWPPLNLRLRTIATLAVHGKNAPDYIHPAFSGSRSDILAALGVAGEPDSRQLISRLQQLRDRPEEGADLAAETAAAYQALAERLKGDRQSRGELTLARLRQLFSEGPGLIYTNAGWLPPPEVLRGNPVFGRYGTFVPQIPTTEPLWSALQVRTPDLDDCLNVMNAISRQRCPDADTRTVILETLRLMVTLISGNAPVERQKRRMRKLLVWTTQGWARRPTYAVDDLTLAMGIGDRLPVWQPGGELVQFSELLTPLRLDTIGADNIHIVDSAEAYEDSDLTTLFQDSAQLLREDLARNDPNTERSIGIGWEQLSQFRVCISPKLSVRIDGLPDPLTVNIRAKIDRNLGVLYVTDTDSLARVDGGGRAVAALFSTDPRRLSQAWLAAVEAAREGRQAERLKLAAERAAEEASEAASAIAAKRTDIEAQTKLAELQAQAVHRRVTGGKAGKTASAKSTASITSNAGQVDGTGEKAKPRVLVDPSALIVVDPDGTIVTATGHTSEPRRKLGTSPRLPEPKVAGATPTSRSIPRAYTDLDKENLGLQLVMRVLSSNAHDMTDLRAQHGVGSDAVDELEQFYELKVSAGSEPEEIVLEDSQIRRAMSTEGFFLVVVSGLEGSNATPKVRIIANPLDQLRMSKTSVVKFSGVRQSNSLVYELRPKDDASP